MISTKASAVSGPTPGCVISRSTSGCFLASCSAAPLAVGQNERSAYRPNGISKFRQSPEPFTSPRLISIGKGNEDIPAPLTMSQ
jgi:hypothetical protein